MLKLARYLKYYKLQVTIGPVFKLLEAVFELIVPLIMANIIDIGVKNGDTNYIAKQGVLLVILGVTGLLSALICQYSASFASQGVGTILRRDLFHHINTLSHKEIDKIGTPSLITRMTSDINQIQLAVAMLIRLVIRAPFLVVGAMIMASTVSLKLSVIFFGAAVLIGLTLYIIMSKSVPFFKTIQKRLDRISLISRENLRGNRVIRAFARQDEEEEKFSKAAQELTDASISAGRISVLLSPLTCIITNIAIALIIWFGGMNVNIGELSQGDIIALVNYMTQIMLAMVVVADLVVIFTRASASAQRINEIFETKTSVTEEKAEKNPTAENDNAIEFRNVSFSYGEGEALKNVTFSIKKGETLGIIGGTGSGKSTFVNLIPRFYDATKGQVLVNGIDVKKYEIETLREKIGVVAQKTVLFKGSLRKNMQWGKEKATDEEIIKALKIAQSWDFVEKLPGKLDFDVAQGGKNFSGGQRQRLTIARALVKQPDILILDDSFSALDFATDANLRKELKEQTRGMTVVIVSQRASTIRNADKIVVLDEGECVGIGTHQELYKNCSEYREICLSQLSAEEAV
ncbi:MAG: ABC transporter ATP-binding protein/permease [Anaeromassilibacillus sp.]|nr:ABC transporter ATP-binding protein/permease [Anaeromassilibacillus sp.]MDY3779175.1 ABC transporter ATP-binding protein [Candidatus Limousia pullorum]